jgi:serine/threonine protein kinase
MAVFDDFPVSPRFEARRRLGAGAFGVVYEAFDRQRRALVALKTLKSPESNALYFFKREFRALSDLNHRNLVTLYELVAESPQWFFTMELLSGRHFTDYVRDVWPASAPVSVHDSSPQSLVATAAAPDIEPRVSNTPRDAVRDEVGSIGYPLDYGRLRAALAQLADGLIALHGAGKLHRDIKPHNVIVTLEGRVVLLDFGLVADVDESATRARIARVAGTPAYMAPEQAAGERVSPASDWYSVGVMLYEALTSRLPFSGSARDVIVDKQHADPVPVEARSPDVPRDLSELCGELLARDPAKRPSGRDVLARLSVADRGPVQTATVISPASTFVGRERELEWLRSAYQTMTAGRTVAAYVHGISGIGKTTVIHQFLRRLEVESPETVVLRGRCYQQESVPYKGLDLLIDSLSQWLREVPAGTADLLLPRDVPALVRLFPVLDRVDAIASTQRHRRHLPDAQELRRRAVAALRELLARLADRWPLVLVVDDLHWSDLDSTHVLVDLLRPPDPPKLLFIGAYRRDEAATSPPLRALLSLTRVAEIGMDVRELALGELDPPQVRTLVAALADADEDAVGRLMDLVHHESGGNPFFVHELTRLAMSTGRTMTAGEVTLESAVSARLANIVGPAARLLQVLALAGRPLSPHVVLSAAGVASVDYGLLTSLRAAQLVRARQTDQSEELELYHDRIGDVIARRVQPDQAIELHERLAGALEASGTADPEMLALHLNQAGHPDRAAGHAAVAADRAAQALAFDRAARLYHVALTLQPNGDEALVLRLKWAEALANAGRGGEAGRAYLAAARDVRLDPARVSELQRRAAEQFLISGHMDEGQTALGEVLRAVDMRLARTPHAALLLLLLRRVLIRLRGLRFRERDVSEVSPRELLKIDSCWSVAVGLAFIDSMRAAEFQARHCLLALASGEPGRVARALALEAGYASLRGTHARRRTAAVARSALSLAERIGKPHAIGLASLTAGIAAHMEGRWRSSLDLSERAEHVLSESCAGVTWELDTARLHIVSNMFFLGDLKGLGDRAPAFTKSADDRGDLYGSTALVLRTAFLTALVRDEPQRARDDLAGAESTWIGRRGFLMQHYWSLMAHADVLAYEGNGAEAYDRVTALWRQLAAAQMRRIQFSRVESSYRRARSALMYALMLPGGSPRTAQLLRDVARECRVLLSEPAEWSIALGHLVQAGAVAAHGDLDRARTALTIAEQNFEAAGMALHATISRRARGRLIGGEQGASAIDAADAWLRAQRVVRPSAIHRMIAGWI